MAEFSLYGQCRRIFDNLHALSNCDLARLVLQHLEKDYGDDAVKKMGRPKNPKSWRRWDIHWFTSSKQGDDEREFIYRTIYKEDGGRLDITAAHRTRFLVPGWQQHLKSLRSEQREAGVPDSKFWPKGYRRKGLQ